MYKKVLKIERKNKKKRENIRKKLNILSFVFQISTLKLYEH